jgi:hypothetical protein
MCSGWLPIFRRNVCSHLRDHTALNTEDNRQQHDFLRRGSKAGSPIFPCREILRHAKDPCSMKEMLVGKIHRHFSLTFSCFATRCVCWLLLENTGGGIRNDQNSGREAKSISNGCSVWDALCHPVNNNSGLP